MEPSEPTAGQRIQRTGTQLSFAAAMLVILSWLASLANLDLNAGDGTDLPAEVAVAVQAILTLATSAYMNRSKS